MFSDKVEEVSLIDFYKKTRAYLTENSLPQPLLPAFPYEGTEKEKRDFCKRYIAYLRIGNLLRYVRNYVIVDYEDVEAGVTIEDPSLALAPHVRQKIVPRPSTSMNEEPKLPPPSSSLLLPPVSIPCSHNATSCIMPQRIQLPDFVQLPPSLPSEMFKPICPNNTPESKRVPPASVFKTPEAKRIPFEEPSTPKRVPPASVFKTPEAKRIPFEEPSTPKARRVIPIGPKTPEAKRIPFEEPSTPKVKRTPLEVLEEETHRPFNTPDFFREEHSRGAFLPSATASSRKTELRKKIDRLRAELEEAEEERERLEKEECEDEEDTDYYMIFDAVRVKEVSLARFYHKVHGHFKRHNFKEPVLPPFPENGSEREKREYYKLYIMGFREMGLPHYLRQFTIVDDEDVEIPLPYEAPHIRQRRRQRLN